VPCQGVADGCTYVIHVASPVALGVGHAEGERLLVRPAVEGTTTVMRTAAKAGVKVR
jgi:nucleoside-diphosphate-sugar epimerase